MNTHHHRRTLPSLPRTLLTTASLALTTAHALVLPTSLISHPATGSLGTAQHTGSSVRKSINFGPSVHAATHQAHNPSPALSVWNANHFAALHAIGDKCDALVDDGTRAVARCVGQQLAASFVEQLHPDADFRLVDTVLSQHSGVVHAHFVQQIDGVPVANANLNVNVDLASGKVLSYGDSSFVGSVKALEDSATGAYSRSRRASAWKQRVQSWATDAVESIEHAAGQVVFGTPSSSSSSSSSDTGPQGTRTGARASAADPRQGLLTFLGIQSNNVQLSTRLESAPRAQLVDEMTVAEASSDDKHDFEIALDVADLDEPVKATLTYVHDGADLKLAWKYEVKSTDNMYEAYLTADGSVAPGDEVPLLVVDWVRDFAPTGGELGIDSRVSDVPLRELAQERASAVTSAPVASTTDKKEVAAMRQVKPAYKVFPWGVNAPDEGKRAVLRGTLVELDAEASPAGWHTVPGEKRPYGDGVTPDTFYYETRGNNVMAQDNPSGGNSASGFRANGGKDMNFKFGIHMPKEGHPLEPTSYIEASTTELFYTNNEIHDLYHRYGFDEEAGNFQDTNFGRGGYGGDAVQANAQDGSGYNNANFATPPDGQRPRMRMYVWNGQQPYRDGDFEAGIVIHEYSHGLSTRLTGGPANSGCLGWGEAGGMGEGWGDFLATMIRMHDVNQTDYSMGEWASGRANGIRNYRYSRNLTENPSTYKFLDKPGYWGVHAIGEVWAEMLFEVAEGLIDEYGFHPTLFPPPVNGTDHTGYYDADVLAKKGKKVPAHGNTLAVQLVIDGMKLQPCRPSFQNARDAIVTADEALTGGKNFCIIQHAFARRGLGPASRVVGSTPWGGGSRTEDYSPPSRCADDGGKKKKKKQGKAFFA